MDDWKLSCKKVKFQSTFPRGERQSGNSSSAHTGNFNPRSRVGNDDELVIDAYFDIHFNPRSRVGNDGYLARVWEYCYISIHVPAWGTTSSASSECITFLYFNPRSRVGNDSKFSQIFFAFLCNKYNFSTFYYPFSPFFGVIRFTFLIFVVRILPIFYVYF